MRTDFLPFSIPTIEDEEIQEVVDSLQSGWITTGPKVNTVEEWWAALGTACRTVEEALVDAGREPASFPRYLSLDSSPRFSLSSRGFFEEMVGRAEGLGFTDVITHWPRPDCSRSIKAVRMPMALNRPVVESATAMPARTGPCPSKPVIDISPPMPCAIWSKPGRFW